MADIQSNIDINIDTSSAVANIKLLQSQISAFQTAMSKSSAANAAVASGMQQNLISNINATGKFEASLQTIKTTTESFTTALEKNKLSLGQYFRYSVASSKNFGSVFSREFNTINKVARERVKDLQTTYVQMGREANGALKAVAIRPLMLDMDSLATKTQIAAQRQQMLNQLLKQGSTNLLNFGKNTQWAGRQLMVGFTIPLSMAGTAAAKAYMKIEEASIKLRRVYGDMSTTAAETNAMVKSVRSLAEEYTKYGIAVADTMDMAAKAAAMGKTGSDLLSQVSEASRLAALGGVSQEQSLETTISLTNAFGTAAEELSKKINFLNAVENQTVTSIEDLTIAIPKAGPVVQQLGGDVEDLAFFLTAMREGGINASEGANALKSGLAALINPTGKASEMLAGFGINVKKIVESNKGDLKSTVVEFAKALDTLDPLNRAKAIEQMFGKFQFARLSTLFKNITSEGTQASKTAALANMSAIQLAAMSDRELKKIESSPMYKFQKAITDLQSKIAPIGETFLKAVTPILEGVGRVLDGINGMGEGFRQFLVVGTAVVGGIAPVMLMLIGLVANGAANIIKLFANIKSFFNRANTASQILGETTSYLTTEQIKAESVAASLDQVHSKLTQTFTSEAGAIGLVTAALQRQVAAQNAAMPAAGLPGFRRKMATGGMISGPGTGTSDSIPILASDGEFVMPAKQTKQYLPILQGMVAGNLPGFNGKNGNIVGAGSRTEEMHLAAALPKNATTISAMSRLEPGFATLNPGLMDMVQFLGDLTSTKSELLNQRARSTAGMTSADFQAEWSKNPNGLAGTASRAEAAGQMIADSANESILRGMDSEIGRITSKKIDELPKSKKKIRGWLDKLIIESTDEVINSGLASSDPKVKNVARGLEARKNTPVTWRTAEIRGKIDPVTGMPYKNAQDFGSKAISRGWLSEVKGKVGAFAPGVSVPLLRPAYNGKTSADRNEQRMQATAAAAAGMPNPFSWRTNSASRGVYSSQIPGGSYERPITQAMGTGMDGAFKSAKKIAKIKSPSQRANDEIGQPIMDGIAQGIVENTKKVEKALSQSVDTAINTAGRRATRKAGAPGSASQSGAISKSAARRARTQEGYYENGTFIPTMNGNPIAPSMASAPLGPTKATRLQRIKAGYQNIKSGRKQVSGAKVSGVGFGASVALGAASMIGGPVGQIAGTLSPIIGVLSMFGGAISKIIPMLLRFAGPIGIAATVIGGLITVVNLVNDAKKKEVEQIRVSSNAHKTFAKTAESLASLAGVNKKPAIAASKASNIATTGATGKQISDIDTILQSDQFTNKEGQTYKDIQKVKKMTDEAAKAYISTMAQTLVGQGVAEQDVDTIIKAIQLAAGKKNLALDFKSITLTNPKNLKNIQSQMDSFNKIIDENKSKFQLNYDEGTTSITGDKMAYEKYLDAIKSKTALAKENMAAFNDQYVNGSITLKQYNAGIKTVISSIKNMDAASQAAAMTQLFADQDESTKKMANSLTDVSNKMLYYQAVSMMGSDAVNAKLGTIPQTIDNITNATARAAAVEAYRAQVLKGTVEENLKFIKSQISAINSIAGGGGGGAGKKSILQDMLDQLESAKKIQKLLGKGQAASFAEFLGGLSKEDRSKYVDKNNNLTSQGNKLKTAYNSKILVDFNNSQTKVLKSFSEEQKTKDALVSTGLDYVSAMKAATDEDVRAAVVAALSIKNLDERKRKLQEIANLVNKVNAGQTKSDWKKQQDAQIQDVQNANAQVVAYDKLVKAGMSAAAAFEMVQDAALAASIAGASNTEDLEAYIKTARKIAILAEKLKNPNQRIVDNAQKQIDVYQAQSTTYQDALSILQTKEEKINETYNKRIEALDKVLAANQAISEQQQGQLDLADALSRGDMAAAARSAADMRAKAAETAIETQKSLLTEAKDAQVKALNIVVNSQTLTMQGLTDKISELESKMSNIRLNTIDPANEAIAIQANNNIITDKEMADTTATYTAPGNSVIATQGKTAAEIAAEKAAADKLAKAAKTAAAKAAADKAAKDKAAKDKAAKEKAAKEAKAKAIALQKRMVLNPNIKYASNGGIVPQYLAGGGISFTPKGTDTVPAMLTPGEFVVTRGAVSKYGTELLSKINSEEYSVGSLSAPRYSISSDQAVTTGLGGNSSNINNSSVYNNYTVNVSAGSNSTPDDIARIVVNKIRGIDSQRIRGNRL